MATVAILIGNTDNKLTQREWAEFCEALRLLINKHAAEIFFQGGSTWDAPLQDACWVLEVDQEQIEPLKTAIRPCRKKYRQDAVAFTLGTTEFV